jgi:hypothetical protein
MTKYNSASHRKVIPRTAGPHPIWNGIGCLMMLIVPVISFGLGVLSMDAAVEQDWPIPASFLGYVDMPDIFYDSDVLIPIANAIAEVENLVGYLVFTFVYVVILGGFLSFAYALVYRFVGPPTYGPMDMPPPRGGRAKRYKR